MLPPIGQGIGLYKWEECHEAVLRRGIELGLNYLDSAEEYAGSEELIGRVIQDHREDVIVGTKFSPQNSTYAQVLEAAEQSLSRLKTDYIDLYQLHWPDPNVPLKDSIEAMSHLKDQGKIKQIGVGNLNESQLKQACAVAPIFSFQTEYNLFDRSIENRILPFCRENGIRVIAYSPLDRGRLCPKKQRSRLDSLALKYNKDPSQIALSWIISQGCTPIPTARQMEHLVKNAEARFSMEEEDLSLLSDTNSFHLIPPSEIVVSNSGEDARPTYRTLNEAKANLLGFIPSPLQLASFISEDRDIKPVRVIESEGKFVLIEGRIRYWGWVIALDNEPIPALVRDNFEV